MAFGVGEPGRNGGPSLLDLGQLHRLDQPEGVMQRAAPDWVRSHGHRWLFRSRHHFRFVAYYLTYRRQGDRP
jgi:hypothetical protein